MTEGGQDRSSPSPVAARERIAALYRHFAEVEAPGRSPFYVQVASQIAADSTTIGFLAQFPEAKWQPNLLLAAVRYLYGTPPGAREFIALVHRHPEAIAAVMRVRSTQTNEPARCATLLPVFAQLPQPLALLEVGASAGLCLLPDRYAYDYGGRRIEPSAPTIPEPPVFPCRASAGTPIPERNVDVAWRAGLDLHPVDLDDPTEIRWLEALVWPGEEYRLPRLRAACQIARRYSPWVVRGDLLTDLRPLADRAPPDATLVVFHTAVLAYVPDAGERAAFARSVADLDAVWIANEGQELIPGIDTEILRDRPDRDVFLLAVNGQPVAWTDGHGTSLDWRDPTAAGL